MQNKNEKVQVSIPSAKLADVNILDRENIIEESDDKFISDVLEKNLTELAFKYPYDVQKMQLIEEIGELLQALSKFERANGQGQPTKVSQSDALKNLIEEFAGVQVMMFEMMKIFSIEKEIKEEMEFQTNRTLEREMLCKR